jgi:predicted Zn-dependent protease with MMP-like domain
MTRQEFQQVVSEALEELPPPFRDALDNLDIQVRWAPTPDERRRTRLRPGMDLFGVYLGIPLTKRGRG